MSGLDAIERALLDWYNAKDREAAFAVHPATLDGILAAVHPTRVARLPDGSVRLGCRLGRAVVRGDPTVERGDVRTRSNDVGADGAGGRRIVTSVWAVRGNNDSYDEIVAIFSTEGRALAWVAVQDDPSTYAIEEIDLDPLIDPETGEVARTAQHYGVYWHEPGGFRDVHFFGDDVPPHWATITRHDYRSSNIAYDLVTFAVVAENATDAKRVAEETAARMKADGTWPGPTSLLRQIEEALRDRGATQDGVAARDLVLVVSVEAGNRLDEELGKVSRFPLTINTNRIETRYGTVRIRTDWSLAEGFRIEEEAR